MSRIKKPTLTEPVAPAGNPTMAYLDAKYAYHRAWSDYYGAMSDRYMRRAIICVGIAGGFGVLGIVVAIIRGVLGGA